MMGAKFFFFCKKNSNSCNFTNQDIGKQTAPFSPCAAPSTDPWQCPHHPPPHPPTLQPLLRSITKVYPSYSTSPTCIFNHFYFQQVKTLNPVNWKKSNIYIAFILIFDAMVINLSVIWWTFSPFDTLTFTNLYRSLSLHLNVNSKICVIRCSI